MPNDRPEIVASEGSPRAPLRARLDRLIALADTLPTGRPADPTAWDSAALAALGDADDLAQLFDLALGLVLRQGPADDRERPAHLLSLASRASRVGLLRVKDAVALRQRLDRLEREARQRGLWSQESPFWWYPLPPPTRLETTWRAFEPDPEGETPAKLGLPDRVTLHRALERPTTPSVSPREAPDEAPGWLHLDRFSSTGLAARLFLELCGLPASLDFERAGVAEGHLSAKRSDTVCYLNGLEPVLLHDAPTLALTVQWLLSEIAPRVAAALGRPVFAPERAMLARYPAPSFGYAPHLDNPGGEHDNGRDLTLVFYLQDRSDPCQGGEIALWHPEDSTEAPPAGVFSPVGGSAVLFDARRVPHQVRPLGPGPDRWALTLWLADVPRRPPVVSRPPRLEVDPLLAPIESPSLPPETVLFHRFDDDAEAGRFQAVRVRPTGDPSPTLGLVSTVYRAGHLLEAWCAHHLELGVEHLLLIFDHLEEPGERATADRLGEHWGPRLSIWSGTETAERRWPAVAAEVREPLIAAAGRHGAADAVAARQALNASAALTAFRQGVAVPRIDWLLHLDADERLVLGGSGRGGATLGEHLAAAHATSWDRLRYLVHELLEPVRGEERPRFKINPLLARCHLGSTGWRQLSHHLEMAQDAPRPYFRAHFNGKSAVRVERGMAAAGVHDWRLASQDTPASEDRGAVLSGPWILHYHFGSPEAFGAKYRAMARAGRTAERLFPPSATETAALALIERLEAEGVDEPTVRQRLAELHHRLTHFTAEEIALLGEAGLLVAV